MNKRILSQDNVVNASITMVGIGSISAGSLSIISDAPNIRMDTIDFKVMIYSTKRTEPMMIPFPSPPIEKRTVIQGTTQTIPPLNLEPEDQSFILGNFKVDSLKMAPGDYKIKVVLTYAFGGRSYIQDDTVEYHIKDFYEENPWLAWIVPAIVGALVSVPVGFALGRGSKKKR